MLVDDDDIVVKSFLVTETGVIGTEGRFSCKSIAKLEVKGRVGGGLQIMEEGTKGSPRLFLPEIEFIPEFKELMRGETKDEELSLKTSWSPIIMLLAMSGMSIKESQRESSLKKGKSGSITSRSRLRLTLLVCMLLFRFPDEVPLLLFVIMMSLLIPWLMLLA